MTTPTHLFFDLGDTLLDLRELVPEMQKQVDSHFPKHGSLAGRIAIDWVRNTVKFIRQAQGSPFRPGTEISARALSAALNQAGIAVDFQTTRDLVQGAWASYVQRAKFYDDVTPGLLTGLHRRMKVTGIVTDSDTSIMKPLIERLKMRKFFDVIVVSESVGAYKPDARIFRAALRLSKGTASSSLFVSDSIVDLGGAAAIGMGTVWLCRGSEADYPEQFSDSPTIRSLTELPRVLDEWQ